MSLSPEEIESIKGEAERLYPGGLYAAKYVQELYISQRIALMELVSVLKGYEQWEADILSEDKLWWPNRAKDVMSGKIYETMLELQVKRTEALDNYNKSINK